MGLLPGTQHTELSVLKWERLGTYSDVRIQNNNVEEREREREREREKGLLDTTRNK